VQGGQSFVGAGQFAEGEGGPAGRPAEVGEVLLDVELFLFGGDDDGVGVGLLLDCGGGEVGRVALDDVVGGARQSLLVEAVLEDVALRCHECNLNDAQAIEANLQVIRYT
jgi:hypothetical protein